MKKILGILMLAALALVLPPQVNAAEKKMAGEGAGTATTPEKGKAATTTSASADKAERALPFQGTVETVNAESKTFTTKNKKGKVNTFSITEETTITKDDAPATLQDLTAGETIRGTRRKTGDNSWEAVKVMIGAKPGGGAAPKGKAKAEKME